MTNRLLPPSLHPLGILLLLCIGCRTTYLPPQRPFAGMYPTVTHIRDMREMHPLNVDVVTIESHLREMNLWEPLEKAGLQPGELAIISRGLSQRGYAELDARRCPNCPVKIVLFAGLPDGETLRILGDVNGEPIQKSWKIAATTKEQEPTKE